MVTEVSSQAPKQNVSCRKNNKMVDFEVLHKWQYAFLAFRKGVHSAWGSYVLFVEDQIWL